MERCQLYTLATLPLWKTSPVPTEQDAGWAEAEYRWFQEELNLMPRIKLKIPQSSISQSSPYTKCSICGGTNKVLSLLRVVF